MKILLNYMSHALTEAELMGLFQPNVPLLIMNSSGTCILHLTSIGGGATIKVVGNERTTVAFRSLVNLLKKPEFTEAYFNVDRIPSPGTICLFGNRLCIVTEPTVSLVHGTVPVYLFDSNDLMQIPHYSLSTISNAFFYTRGVVTPEMLKPKGKGKLDRAIAVFLSSVSGLQAPAESAPIHIPKPEKFNTPNTGNPTLISNALLMRHETIATPYTLIDHYITQVSTKVFDDRIEIVYLKEPTTSIAFSPGRREVYKVIYSCVDGKFHASEPIYGTIVPANSESYKFD